MRTKLSSSRASISGIFSILAAITLGAGPIATALTKKYGYRNVAIAGSCIATFGFFLSYWWANIWFYYITISCIGGLGLNLMYLSSINCLQDHFDENKTRAMGVAVSGSGVGTFVVSYFMNQIVNIRSWFSYSSGLLIEAGLIAVTFLLGFLLSSAKPKTNEKINLKLFKNSAFTLFIISNFLISLGFNVVYNYADDLANDAEVVKEQRSYILMSIGISNIFGRLIIGFLGNGRNDKKRRLYLFILTYIISGIATAVAPQCGSSVIQHIVYASFFGFFSGGYVTLSFILPSDIVKDEEVNDAIGLLCLFSGIAVAIGTPVVGAMRDVFEHFARPFFWPYFIFRTCTIFSGYILFAIPFLQKQYLRKHPKEKGSILEEELLNGK
ncbi:unnamed protein product [Adineta steineri]|uniref:Major facilitator superfamily (MFS) profile domain-containing protein n=1 Tax=Adineta steineri TaxID=433720 RepID=A0A819KPM3_9BILA|nr:unnamed protein product [Adineta steineri]CAF1444388.1 unnamed protein product [Adineta steineri]CAF3949581.1 unnamed protein product [Adineta steineri]CAF4142390.1 unnamed protein product [Adineta steineri]